MPGAEQTSLVSPAHNSPSLRHVKAPSHHKPAIPPLFPTRLIGWLSGANCSPPERKMFRPLLPRHCSALPRSSSLFHNISSTPLSSIRASSLQSKIRISVRAFTASSNNMSKV